MSLHPPSFADSSFYLSALHESLFAASPRADLLSDPYVYAGCHRPCVCVPIVFNDIPDHDFRDPRSVIRIRHLAGGTKS
jgi:hypothetical protein